MKKVQFVKVVDFINHVKNMKLKQKNLDKILTIRDIILLLDLSLIIEEILWYFLIYEEILWYF